MKKCVKELAKILLNGIEEWEKADFVAFDGFVNSLSERDKFFLINLYNYVKKGKPELETVHNAWAKGYLKKCCDGYKETYVGRYGAGYIQHWRSPKSSNYHVIEYHIIEY